MYRGRFAALLTILATVLGVALAVQPADARIVPGSPIGHAEDMFFHPGGMRFIGWAYDPDRPKTALTVYVTVDGRKVGSTTANRPRPDVAKAHPSAGPNHGFQTFFRISEGTHTICVWARNIGKHGLDLQMRCQHRTLDYGPVGKIDRLRVKYGEIWVKGWAYDMDNRTAPVTVDFNLDGKVTKVVAKRNNPEAATFNKIAKPSPGPLHGFSVVLPTSQGVHHLSVVGENIGYGTNNTFVNQTVRLNDSPRGGIDTLAQQSGKLRLRGWAFDPDDAKAPATVTLTIDGTSRTIPADLPRSDIGAKYTNAGPNHGFDQKLNLAEGTHTITVVARNVSFGSDLTLVSKTVRLNFTPSASLTSLAATSTGVTYAGWTSDPDTSSPISARISVDGRTATTLVAKSKGSSHNGHNFSGALTLTSGKHTVCVVGLNVLYGTHNSASSCKTITLALNPLGRFESLKRASGSSNLTITGWAFDPDSQAPINVTVRLDGKAVGTLATNTARSDVAKSYPMADPKPGLVTTITADAGEHTVCLTADNVSGGVDRSLGCRLIIAVHPVAPSAPQAVQAMAGYGGATVTWTPPTSDGGAPWSKYVVTATPSGATVTVGPKTTTATVLGLKPKTTYSFSVVAVNVAGTSAAAASAKVTTQASPPPQTTPAPVSTSRYIRNIRGASSTELAMMTREGAADATANPSGHGYLILLDIGGQDDADGGVVLSATTRFVSYADLVKDLEAYVDGYHSKQRPSAPITIALGTNNDMQVSSTSGRHWADRVVDPVVAYAKARYPGMTIAGANDIEPGFRATYSQTKSWLGGYLGATTAPFVFNGSADGCSWTRTNSGCNNGWAMSGLYYLAAGAAPIRMLNLPQIYNTAMSGQWKYISLTGVGQGHPRINFAGTLTEWTACDQSNSCGSLTGHSAWSSMWSNLQSDARLKVGSLPYSTDLRIDS